MQMRFSAAEQSEVWDRFEAGESMRSIAPSIGRSQGAVRSDPEDRRHQSARSDRVVRTADVFGRPRGDLPWARHRPVSCAGSRPVWDGRLRQSLERCPPTAESAFCERRRNQSPRAEHLRVELPDSGGAASTPLEGLSQLLECQIVGPDQLVNEAGPEEDDGALRSRTL